MHPILRIVGISSVFLIALVAWLALGGVTSARTGDQAATLRGSVTELFGGPHRQAAPTFTREWSVRSEEVEDVTDSRGVHSQVVRPRWVRQTEAVPPSATDIDVTLNQDARRKGLLWFPLYNVTFAGKWTYTHDISEPRDVRVHFAFPMSGGQFDGFAFEVDGVDVSRKLEQSGDTMEYVIHAVPEQVVTLAIRYASRGMDTWTYEPVSGVGQVEAFALRMQTDFSDIDFPAGTLSPSTRAAVGGGEALAWTFTRMVTGQGMGMVMPTHIQPGELATQLSFSAPIPLGLYFLWIFVLGMLRRIEIHPVNYLFLAAAFFSFNLLFAYTADRLPVEWAFGIASVVSVALVTSYLRLVVGPRFAFAEAGLAQILYQVGFGVAHFSPGSTGLTITVLGILTLFALMQLTGRIRWREALSVTAPAR